MKIAFHSYQLGERGTEICLYRYAKYNQEILGNESVIISTSSRPTPTLSRFEDEFETILYPDVWKNETENFNNEGLRSTLNKIVDEKNIDMFYAIKGGENDHFMPTNCKTLAHSIFRMDDPHGDVYAGVCEYICKAYESPHPWVHHIIEDVTDPDTNWREQLGIPKDALVLGRHGGYDTFNIPFVYNSIAKILEQRKDIYFVFLGTQPIIKHDRVKYIGWTGNLERIGQFVNTCDAMIHARTCGEIFSLALADFSKRNKPIICFPGGRDTGHVHLLENKGLYYKDEKELDMIFKNITKDFIINGDWDVYKDTYSPKNVMNEFQEVFIDG